MAATCTGHCTGRLNGDAPDEVALLQSGASIGLGSSHSVVESTAIPDMFGEPVSAILLDLRYAYSS